MTDGDVEQGFQVRDRRHRSDESGPRPEAQRPEAGRADRAAGSGVQRGAAEAGRGEAPPRGAPSLVGLFAMLAGLAAAALEGTADPASGQARPDLAQASELIDLLILLREKTEGHRTSEESRTLEGLIYELQMKYVRTAVPPR